MQVSQRVRAAKKERERPFARLLPIAYTSYIPSAKVSCLSINHQSRGHNLAIADVRPDEARYLKIARFSQSAESTSGSQVLLC
jgi:hypothetical protein